MREITGRLDHLASLSVLACIYLLPAKTNPTFIPRSTQLCVLFVAISAAYPWTIPPSIRWPTGILPSKTPS
jgi:hypothetical protein